MKKLIVFPFNGNALEAMDCIADQFELIAFADDTLQKHGISDYGIPVSSRDIIQKYPEAQVLAVPGSSTSYKSRKQLIASLQLSENRFAKLIHPSASISNYATVGLNTLVMAGVVISNKARLGNHLCILPNSVIHHDVSIRDYTLIGSSVVIAGYTDIGENCYIGSGSSIINSIQIGEGTLIGMGSNVIRSVESHSVIAGNPARHLYSK
jgi:sugar O-acyltransferase (sialic acid O-acetyltransferase NeuD family)